jgi:hypothetical protein
MFQSKSFMPTFVRSVGFSLASLAGFAGAALGATPAARVSDAQQTKPVLTALVTATDEVEVQCHSAAAAHTVQVQLHNQGYHTEVLEYPDSGIWVVKGWR